MTLSAFVKKFGKAASFTQEDTSFGAQVQLGYGTPVQGIYPYTIEFQKQDDTFYLNSIQSFSPKSAHYQSKKNLKNKKSLLKDLRLMVVKNILKELEVRKRLLIRLMFLTDLSYIEKKRKYLSTQLLSAVMM